MIDYSVKNLKFLRAQVFGETQQELADALVISNSAICKYESGERSISVELLNGIANHYGISVDSLMEIDLSQTWPVKLPYDSFKNIEQLYLDYYHLFVSEEALRNEYFKEACEKYIVDSSSDTDVDVIHQHVERCLNLFIKSCEQGRFFESIANIVMLMILDYGTLQTVEQSRIIEKMLRNRNNEKEVIRSYFQYREGYSLQYQNKRREYIAEHYEGLLYYLNILKQFPDGVELAYFYMALMFYMGYTDNQLSLSRNVEIGLNMMVSYAYTGNTYARSFVRGMYNL